MSTFRAIDTGILIEQLQMAARAKFNGRELDIVRFGNSYRATLPIEANESRGEARPVMFLRNRNDGRTALRFSLGFHRIICNNGLIVPGLGENIRLIHRYGPTLQSFLSGFHDMCIRVFDQLTSVDFAEFRESLESLPVDEATGIQLIGSLPMSRRARMQCMYVWCRPERRRDEDRGYTAWHLYNLVNEMDRRYSPENSALTREMTRIEDIQLLLQPTMESEYELPSAG